jgi:hypothetical protein
MKQVLLVGIDEAGYGPLLGPLVVSATSFQASPPWLNQSLWVLLKASISSTFKSRSRKLPICDSKKLHQPSEGIARLEKSALAAIHALSPERSDLRGLLELLCPQVVPLLEQYPWYRKAQLDLPRKADAGAVAISSSVLSRDIANQNGRIMGIWSEVLLEEQFNRMVASTRNKAVVLLGLTTRLIHRIVQAHPGCDLRICVDKQGGRDFYGRALLRAFEDRRLKVIAEEENHSEYELSDDRTSWRISFDQGGEGIHMPIALASLISKYVRELLMECFNTYWLNHVPTIRPTAGYYKDGIRFLGEIRPHFARLGIDSRTLVRER